MKKKNVILYIVPAVVPIVLYNRKEVWDVPHEFRKIIYNEELFGDSIIFL